VGRIFAFSNASIYQFSILYQNDLEINPARDMEIAGAVVCNNDMYVGGGISKSVVPIITFNNSVYYGGNFNNHREIKSLADLSPFPTVSDYTDPVTGLESSRPTKYTYNIPLDVTQRFTIPVFALGYNPLPNNNPIGLVPIERDSENFIGGVSAVAAVRSFPIVYQNNVNNVYRSIIEVDPGEGVAENAIIKSRRMYNRAKRGGLIITTSPFSIVRITRNLDGTYTTPTSYTGYFTPADNTRNPFSTETMTDPREAWNIDTTLALNLANKTITTIDMARFRTLLEAAPFFNDGGGVDGSNSFNGIVYVQITDPFTSALRIKNAERLPDPANNKGFTVVTNGGIYIQGDYNTIKRDGTPVDTNGTGAGTIPAAIMADAITALSRTFVDEGGVTRGWQDRVWPDILNKSAPERDVLTRTASENMTICAALVTGNYRVTDSDHKGGGVQNLVRYVENWSRKTVILFGTLSQLFYSRYYVAPWPQNVSQSDLSHPDTTRRFRGPNVNPDQRLIRYNVDLNVNPPNLNPMITNFSRGEFLYW
jgi:hypothetical protein